MTHPKKISAMALAAALTLAAIGSAHARDRDAAVAAGVVGGLALGTVLGGSLAAPPPAGGYYYAPPPRRVYVPAEEEDDCGYHRVPLYDEYGDFAGYKRVRNRC